MSTAAEVRIALEKMGEATVEEIANSLGIGLGDSGYHSVGQALSTGTTRGWSHRIGRARYAWVPNGSQPVPATPAELQPLIDRIGDDAFDTVGLTYVARTQDGAFICTDQQGVAWRVEVTATARLI
jgi:hypothetical protein